MWHKYRPAVAHTSALRHDLTRFMLPTLHLTLPPLAMMTSTLFFVSLHTERKYKFFVHMIPILVLFLCLSLVLTSLAGHAYLVSDTLPYRRSRNGAEITLMRIVSKTGRTRYANCATTGVTYGCAPSARTDRVGVSGGRYPPLPPPLASGGMGIGFLSFKNLSSRQSPNVCCKHTFGTRIFWSTTHVSCDVL